jgi:hypothetical protein
VVDEGTNEEIENTVFIWQLGRLMKYQHDRGDLRSRVSKAEWRDLVRYFRFTNLPNPTENEDIAIGILVVHRRRVEAADPAIRDRTAIVIDRVVGWDGYTEES